MKMKAKNIVLSFLGSAALVCLSLGVGLSVGSPVEAQAAQTTIFECPGASIRMNKQDGLNGIRFPMFMDDTTFNTLTSNATIQSEDVTFGTLIIPTDKLTGTLDINTALAKNLVTYGYNEKDEFVNVWTECTDEDYPDCMQGYAYIHSIPDTSLDRNLTAVGYYTVDGGESYVYTQPIERHVSYVADAAIKSGDYSEAQMLKLEDFLASYTVKFDVDSEITTQQVKYGKTLSFPEVSVPMGRTLNWFERVGGTDEPIWSEQELDMSQESLTVKKDGEYKAYITEYVEYSTTIYNKENIFGSDPSVTYRDGWYYYVYFDSQQRIFVLKSQSLEEILEGGTSGWGHGNATCIYTPEEGDELGADIWAPELQYIQGKWYIYVCGVPYGSDHNSTNMRMFVLECESQDPTGAWKYPVRIGPSDFDSKYAIDGHVFEFNGQLYYAFSGQKSAFERPRIYICTMSSPTSVNNDAVNISQGSSLEEGPCTIIDGSDLYLMYSLGDYDGVNYHVQYYKLTGNADPLIPRNWTAMGTCLEADSVKDVHCTGHNHIFTGEDGRLWTSYHAVVGTQGAGTEEYLSSRRVMVQPVTIENGALNFGGIQDTIVIDDKAGLQYSNMAKTEYLVDGYGSARLWANDGASFTVATTITRIAGDEHCAGITLYERHGDGNLSKLLIGVEEEGNVFFCKDYSRDAYKYKYDGWLFNNESVIELKVTYLAGNSTENSTITIDISNADGSKTWTNTYSLADINAFVSDKVGDESKEFNLHFTGDFEVGLGGNRGKCKFTDVAFGAMCNVTFVDEYGRETTTTYIAGETLEVPTLEEREGFEFLGWAERIGDDEYTTPGEITDLTVNTHREFVAVFQAIDGATTYEKPAIGANVYNNETYSQGVKADGGYVLNTGAGAAFFEDVEIAQGQDYVVYATLSYVDNPNMVGFAVGTLATQAQFAMIAWRSSDIYTVRLANDSEWAWAGEKSAAVSIAPQEAEIAFIYASGTYYFAINGELIKLDSAKINELAGIGASEDALKFGFVTNWGGNTKFADWGVSTDVETIREYIPNYWEYTEVEDFACDGSANLGFTMTATYSVPDASQRMIRMGFDFTTGEGSYMRLVYITNWERNSALQSSMGIQGFDASGKEYSQWYHGIGDVDLTKPVTLSVTYDGNRKFIVYVNGTEKKSAVWNTTSVNGVNAFTYCGTSTDANRATLKVRPYSDLCEITDFNLVKGARVENFACDGSYNSTFDMTATYSVPDASQRMIRMGFDFTTGEGTYMRLVYITNWERNGVLQSSMGIQGFDASGTEYSQWYHGIGDVDLTKPVTLRVVYDGVRKFTVYLNGEEKTSAVWNTTIVNGVNAFTYCGTSTDANRKTMNVIPYSDLCDITGFEFTEGEMYVPEVLEADIENFACDGSANKAFEVSATFNANNTPTKYAKIGFDFTTGEGKIMRLVYVANWNGYGDSSRARMGFMAMEGTTEKGSRWTDVTVLDLSKAVTLRVVHDGNGVFQVFAKYEGEAEFELSATQFPYEDYKFDAKVNFTDKDFNALSYCGTSTGVNRATLTVMAFASESDTAITDFSLTEGEMYAPVMTEANVENFACDGSANQPFEVSATFNANNTPTKYAKIGFDFTTGEGKIMRLVYVANWNGYGDSSRARMGFMAMEGTTEKGSRWTDVTVLDLSKAVTLRVVHDGNGVFQVFAKYEGEAEFELSATQFPYEDYKFDAKVNFTDKDFNALSYCGTSTGANRATMTVTAYASESDTVISDFDYAVTGAFITNFACDISNTYQDYFDSSRQPGDGNPQFEVSATFNAHGTTAGAKSMGFEFSTGNGTKLLFSYVVNWGSTGARIGFKALNADGSEAGSIWRDVSSASVIDLSTAHTITVKYDGNRNFHVYVDGVELVALERDSNVQTEFHLGWGVGNAGLPLGFIGSSTPENRGVLIVKPFTDYPTDIEYSNCTYEVTGGYQG